MTDERKLLLICPDKRAHDALAYLYRHTASVVVKGTSVMGHRAETVIVLPLPDDASDGEKAAYGRMIEESFANRVTPGGRMIRV